MKSQKQQFKRKQCSHLPLLCECLFECLLSEHIKEAVIGDINEDYSLLLKKYGKFIAQLWCWRSLVCSMPHIVFNRLFDDQIYCDQFMKNTTNRGLRQPLARLSMLIICAVGLNVTIVGNDFTLKYNEMDMRMSTQTGKYLVFKADAIKHSINENACIEGKLPGCGFVRGPVLITKGPRIDTKKYGRKNILTQ